MSDFIQPQRRITQAELDAQRRKGWPEFHPEDFCHRCGGPNLTWFTDGDVWNPVMRPDGPDAPWRWQEIICPQCFAELAERLTGCGVIWELRVWPHPHQGAERFAEIADAYRKRVEGCRENGDQK